MKKTLLTTIFVGLGLSYSAWAGPCVSGDTLADYIALPSTGCTFGGITFTNFDYTSSQSGGAFAPDASGVTVKTETIGGEVGFLFVGAYQVSSKQTEDSFITYTAGCTPNCITDVALRLVGAADGTASASVAETTSNGITLIADPSNLTPPPATFLPVGTLDLSKDIGVSGGEDGNAHISGVYNLFSTSQTTTTPEPSMFLLCSGFVVLLPVVRRKFRRG